MEIQEKINEYIESLDENKSIELLNLHQHILNLLPNSKLWFLDGKDENGKVVTNPNIGYGKYTIQYKNNTTKDFYQIGLSANTTGISIYIMGLEDKDYLPNIFGKTIGKAKVTGYCIKFKTVKEIDLSVLDKAIKYGVQQTSAKE